MSVKGTFNLGKNAKRTNGSTFTHVWGGGGLYAWNRYNVAHWRSYREALQLGSKICYFRHFGSIKWWKFFEGCWGKIANSFCLSWCSKMVLYRNFLHKQGFELDITKPKRTLKMAKMCAVSRLERQFATLCLFHTPVGKFLFIYTHTERGGVFRGEEVGWGAQGGWEGASGGGGLNIFVLSRWRCQQQSSVLNPLVREKLKATTKGQNRLGTFPHFLALFHTFSEFFRIFPPWLFLRIKGFYCCFSSKIVKDNKRE